MRLLIFFYLAPLLLLPSFWPCPSAPLLSIYLSSSDLSIYLPLSLSLVSCLRCLPSSISAYNHLLSIFLSGLSPPSLLIPALFQAYKNLLESTQEERELVVMLMHTHAHAHAHTTTATATTTTTTITFTTTTTNHQPTNHHMSHHPLCICVRCICLLFRERFVLHPCLPPRPPPSLA